MVVTPVPLSWLLWSWQKSWFRRFVVDFGCCYSWHRTPKPNLSSVHLKDPTGPCRINGSPRGTSRSLWSDAQHWWCSIAKFDHYFLPIDYSRPSALHDWKTYTGIRTRSSRFDVGICATGTDAVIALLPFQPIGPPRCRAGCKPITP